MAKPTCFASHIRIGQSSSCSGDNNSPPEIEFQASIRHNSAFHPVLERSPRRAASSSSLRSTNGRLGNGFALVRSAAKPLTQAEQSHRFAAPRQRRGMWLNFIRAESRNWMRPQIRLERALQARRSLPGSMRDSRLGGKRCATPHSLQPQGHNGSSFEGSYFQFCEEQGKTGGQKAPLEAQNTAFVSLAISASCTTNIGAPPHHLHTPSAPHDRGWLAGRRILNTEDGNELSFGDGP
jgi:hypothetical protein